ncbi:MAG: acylphosphatase [Gemmatimonadaceae bacterium]
MERIHLEVSGRVQGVGFRWYVVEKARELELAGWVRNRSDGVVEVAAGGGRDALAKLENAVNEGPPGALVQQVRRVDSVQSDSLPKPFKIVR